ncbi:alpha/beta hydrolase [Thalassotalea sp. LPB0316]|uniref:alpha/beta hydrolase n=1 Tax=Thalassotalea sp. LPB0316 TaxID=2769490 RepID=UPI0018689737|nr:alpha/beta hydrolase [Thalassotalea sp. LPB0316]QOL25852.1 alpha/beta hydrolase [Thalassotalea sp. LPB0316]
MLVITNRKINKSNFINGVGDHNAFGDEPNVKGPNETRIAHAEKVNGKWQVRLMSEPSKITANNIPSRKAFNELRDKLRHSGKNCVFFVHGFNQSFEKNLEKAYKMQQVHNVEVVAFSWPSNPGGFKTKEYRVAKRNAVASVGALDATLEKFGSYLKEPFNKEALESCNVKISFMTYSLGNYLFQNYVNNASYEEETRIFHNVILCQADVDNAGHAHWVDQIESGKKVYITINENDWVLKWSDVNFQKDRLGRSAKHLNASNALYFDFTDGPGVGKTHGVFYQPTNDVVKSFFTRVLNGERGEFTQGLVFDSRMNAFRFE